MIFDSQFLTKFHVVFRDCDIPKSTLYLHCNQTTPRLTNYQNPGKNGRYTKPYLKGISKDDVVVEKRLRGIQIKPSKSYMVSYKTRLVEFS